jgi:hypothetical protein
MKRAILALSASVAFGITVAVAGDVPQYRTRWRFQSSYAGVTTTYGDMDTGQIVMPAGTVWHCSKQPVQALSGGLRVGGFSCTSQDAWISVRALCYIAKPDTGHAAATVGRFEAGRATDDYVSLDASCATQTTAVRDQGI